MLLDTQQTLNHMLFSRAMNIKIVSEDNYEYNINTLDLKSAL